MASMMADVVEYLAKALVDEPDKVQVREREEDGRYIIRLDVADDDWGKVIGKNGRIATAMRQMLKVAAVREDVRASLEIGD
jgi:predicted RNA-binding protein YlqC (UPF0109 family)